MPKVVLNAHRAAGEAPDWLYFYAGLLKGFSGKSTFSSYVTLIYKG